MSDDQVRIAALERRLELMLTQIDILKQQQQAINERIREQRSR